MSFRHLSADSQGMALRRPFTWLVLVGICCSMAGLYQVMNEAPSARAVAPAPRASAEAKSPFAGANAAPTTVTEAPPSETATATATPETPAPVAGIAATPTPAAQPSAAVQVAATLETPAAENPGTLPSLVSTASSPSVSSPAKAASLLDLMNQARTKEGLAPLERDGDLEAVALARAQNLVAGGYFDHYAPDGESAFSELAARGIRYRLAGENLARNNYVDARTVQAAFDGLMASPGHRANILEVRFSSAGVAAVQSGKMWIYVTVFLN